MAAVRLHAFEPEPSLQPPLPVEVSKALGVAFSAIEALVRQVYISAAESALKSAQAQPAEPEPVKPKPPRESFESREALAIQWLVALELQSGKLPTVATIAKFANINRGVIYRMRRFVDVYNSRKGERNRLAKLGKVRGPGGDVRRGFRTEGGGVEAVDESER